MYDFCLTYPYAALLALGGVAGFASKGSVPSLIAGMGTAALLAACGHASHSSYQQTPAALCFASSAWPKGRLNKPATAVSLLVAVGLTAMMAARWSRTHKFMPAGLISILSGLMATFYIWNLAMLKAPIKAK